MTVKLLSQKGSSVAVLLNYVSVLTKDVSILLPDTLVLQIVSRGLSKIFGERTGKRSTAIIANGQRDLADGNSPVNNQLHRFLHPAFKNVAAKGTPEIESLMSSKGGLPYGKNE